MCGIKFNTDALEHRCGHCGKLALEEAPEFKASVGLWLCSTCIELPDAVLRGQALENTLGDNAHTKTSKYGND